MSYQQVYLRELQSIDSNAMMGLAQCGFGGSFSGDSFSCLHGDLIKEKFNRQTKSQAGPHCARFNTDIAKVTTCVATSHVHKKFTQNLSEKIQLNTSTNHKECTPVAIRLHNKNGELLEEKLKSCGKEAFDGRKATNKTTGKQLPSRHTTSFQRL